MKFLNIFLIGVTFGVIYWGNYAIKDASETVEVMEAKTYLLSRSSFMVGCIYSYREQVKIVDTAGGRAERLTNEELVKYCNQRASEFMNKLFDKVKSEKETKKED